MLQTTEKRIIYPVIVLSAISLFVPLYAPLQIVSGVIQSFVLPGLVLLFLLGDRDRPWTDNIFFVPLVSPVLLTLTVLLALRITGDLSTSLKLSSCLFYLAFIILALSGRDRFGKSVSPVPSSAVILSVAYGLLIALSYALNDLLLIRSDAWYHASVTSEILSRGVPPMEPWLPDKPIRYMWMYHLFLASWKSLSGLDLFRAMGFFNIVSAFSFPYLIARIISVFISGSRRIFWSSLISIAGLESVSWIAIPVVLARPFIGTVKGAAEFSRIIGNLKFDGPNMAHTLTPYIASMVNLSDKFITITSFSYSFDLFLLVFVLFLSRDYMRKSKIGSAILFFMVILGSFLFHVIVGTALICAVIGAGILLCLLNRFVSKRPFELYPRLMPLAAAAAAAAAGLPYLASLGGTETGGGSFLGEYLHFGLRNLITIALPLLILFRPARKAVGKIFSLGKEEYVLLASWLVPLTALNLFVDLPRGNEDKLIFPLFLLLGPMVSMEITGIMGGARGARKKLLLAWTMFLFLVPPALTFYAFIDYSADEAGIEKRYHAFRGDRTLFEVICSRTENHAIVAERGFDHLMPVFAGRRSLAGMMYLHNIYGYDAEYITDYYDLNNDLFACGPLAGETIDRLAGLDFEIYVAVLREDFTECPFLATKFEDGEGLFELVYADGEGRLYHYLKPGNR